MSNSKFQSNGNDPKGILPRRIIFAVLFLVFGADNLPAEDKLASPRHFTYQVTGLFAPDREKDLRELFAVLPKYKLIRVDYATAEITIEQDPDKTWPNEKPERFVELIDNDLRNVSRGSFGAKAARQKDREQMQAIEIKVAGLDCKGCALGAYRLIYQLPGVENATIDFKLGKIKALVNPKTFDRIKVEKALKQGGVDVLENDPRQ